MSELRAHDPVCLRHRYHCNLSTTLIFLLSLQASCIRSGLPPKSPAAVEPLYNFGVHSHDYHGILIDESETAALREDVGTAKILFMRNRGVVVAASTIPEAWYLVKRVITACQTQVRSLPFYDLIANLCQSILIRLLRFQVFRHSLSLKRRSS